MVGTTGIEPVTPTMSTQCVGGNYSEIRDSGCPYVPKRSRSNHGNFGHFLGLEQRVSAERSSLDSPEARGRLGKGRLNSEPAQQDPALSATDRGAGMKTDANHTGGSPHSKSEEADDYHAVVARLNESWRIIVCAAGIQWILQRRAGERHGKARWEARSFCRTSEALNRLSRRRAGVIDPAAAAILASLPERISTPPQSGFCRRPNDDRKHAPPQPPTKSRSRCRRLAD
jgi:hypothetical protein